VNLRWKIKKNTSSQNNPCCEHLSTCSVERTTHYSVYAQFMPHCALL
jgi:hypothetical protein